MKVLMLQVCFLSLSTAALASVCVQFQSLKSFAFPGKVVAARQADVNDDGLADIVSVTSKSVIVQFGAGDGTFSAQQVTSGLIADANLIVAFDVGDFNHDRTPDVALALTGTPPKVQLLYGSRNGAFERGPEIGLPLTTRFEDPGRTMYPVAIAVGQLGPGNRTDIAVVTEYVSRFSESHLVVFENRGNDRFEADPPVRVTTGPIEGGTGKGLQIVDLNGDRRNDIVVTSGVGSLSGVFVSGGVQAFLNQGNGNQANGLGDRLAAQAFILLQDMAGPVVAGDFNGDGHPDIATLTYDVRPAESQVTVLLGDGNGGLTVGGRYGALNTPATLAAGDYSGDGIPDLMAGAPSGGLVLFPGKGDGSFPSDGYLYLGIPVAAIVAGDFDRDGVPDLAASGSESLVAVLGFNSCSLTPAITSSRLAFPPPTDRLAPYQSATSGDFNGDGKADLAAIHPFDGTAAFLVSILSNGDGTFDGNVKTAVFPFQLLNVFPRLLRSVVAHDLDLDGKLDLVVASNSGTFVVMGNGDGTFRMPTARLGFSALFATVADVNGDQIPDILVSSGVLEVYLGQGGGAFQRQFLTSLTGEGDWLATGDFNRDGKTDVAAASSTWGIDVLMGDGAGRFFRVASQLGGPAAVVLAADVNGDGDVDFVTDRGVLLSRRGALIPYAKLPAVSMQAADLNQDGKLDLVAASRVGTTTFYKGKGDGTFEPFVVGGPDLIQSAVRIDKFRSDGVEEAGIVAAATAPGHFGIVHTGFIELFDNVVLP